MGNTGNKIKALESRVEYLERFLNRMNIALTRLEKQNEFLRAKIASLEMSIEHLELDLKSLKEI